MKKICIFLFAVLFAVTMHAQESPDSKPKTTPNSSQPSEVVFSQRDTVLFTYLDTYVDQLREPRYRLYPTQNTWTFIKLDTMTGQLWQVQYSVDKSPRMEYVLDTTERINSWDLEICGRFVLYETKNMYNFILLDTINGKCWQVQWGIEKEDRIVLRIY